MVKKLGRNITVLNSIAILFIVLIGGVSIYLAADILHKEYEIKEMSDHIKIINGIHTNSFRLLLLIHEFKLDADKQYIDEADKLLGIIEKDLNGYISSEEEETYKDKTMDNLYELRNDFNYLKNVFRVFGHYLLSGNLDKEKLSEYEEIGHKIDANAVAINRIHYDNISQWQKESLSSMWIIIYIYLFFILAGGLSIYIGHRLLSKKIVKPIKHLSAATMEVAKGTLDKRVHTDSKNEIGQLYRSFNEMAEKLQLNDEFLRKFNEELEKKVRERTLALQEANDQLRRTQDALIRTEKIAAVGQIAAGVTHEVKNPLHSLSINTQMLMKELAKKSGADSPAYESASQIKFEVNRINNILEEFVKYAKFPEPQFFDNNVNYVIEEVADFISESARDSNVSIDLSLQENIPVSRFDARQFKEVLINLSYNAIKAMRNGGSLRIKTAMENTNIVITVSDTGEGIADNDLEKIFTPFFSTGEGGMGLGLPIVQKIIESHNGKISCTSRVGEGTTFEIIFPVQKY